MLKFFCQDNGIEMVEYFERQFFNKFGYVVWNSRTNNISAQQLYEDATYSFEEMIEKIQIHHTNGNDENQKSTVITMPSHKSMIQMQHYNKFGKCYTFNPSNELKNLGIGSISTWM